MSYLLATAIPSMKVCIGVSSEAVFSGVCPLGVVVIHPCVEVGLKLFDGGVYLLAESDGVELVLHGTVEPLADAVCLRTLCLYLGVVDVLYCEVEFELVGLAVSAVFGSAVCEHPHHPGGRAVQRKGTTRSLSMSAATSAFLRSYSFAKPILE